MSGTKIKICGLFRLCDAAYVNESMPDYAGLVFYQNSHRYVTEETAKKLRIEINPTIKTVGVFVDAPIQQIKRIYQNNIVSIIQLHGSEDNIYIRKLRKSLPKAVLWKAYKVRSKKDLLQAEMSEADVVLLDHGYGSGVSFDWNLISGFSRDFILAGGLTAQNIPMAIKKFHPFAVDLSSSVETEGVKDKKKISAATSVVKGGEEPHGIHIKTRCQ